MRYMTLLTIPMGLGLALVSRPFVLIFFTEKWAEAIPVMSAISLYTLLRSLTFNAGSVYKATGRPGLLSRLSLVQTMVTIPLLWWAIVTYDTILAVAWAQVALAAVFGVIKLVLAGRLVDVPMSKLFKTFYPGLVGGGLMTVAVLFASWALPPVAPLVELIVSVVVGASVYGLIIWLIQRDDLVQAGAMLRTALRPKTKATQAKATQA
jgi:O-antigen/teichoic acid export membrane protein